MERWIGTRHVSMSAGTICRVAASLCYSPSSSTFSVPSRNVIMFMGDRIEGSGNSVIERLSNLETVASILVSKGGPMVNAWVVEAPHFVGPFAVYKGFTSALTSTGEPKAFDPHKFSASSATASILNGFFKQVHKTGSLRNISSSEYSNEDMSTNYPASVVLGFSKGGVVVNQLLTEVAHLATDTEFRKSNANDGSTSNSQFQLTNKTVDPAESNIKDDELKSGNTEINNKSDFVVPTSAESFLKSIEEFHYVDVGLNCPGAYQTNESVIEGIGRAAMSRKAGIRVVLHGTPRQWCDCRRPWISLEKDALSAALQRESKKHNGKFLKAAEKFYFAEQEPTLQMHFEIIDVLDLS